MSKPKGVPDAWDDNYEVVVDKLKHLGPVPSQIPPAARISRAERKAQHAQANKQIWESAEDPKTFHFVETRNDVPLKSEFKPQLTLLSRRSQKPAAEEDGDDSEEEARQARQASLAERTLQAQRDREEKQRKYAEVRERLFGTASPAPSQDAAFGRTSPAVNSGKTRGVRGSRRGGADLSGRGSQASSTDHSPARPANQAKELYDPDASSKSGPALFQRRGTPNGMQQPIRGPRGPDGSGRGGFGFAGRGDKTNGV